VNKEVPTKAKEFTKEELFKRKKELLKQARMNISSNREGGSTNEVS